MYSVVVDRSSYIPLLCTGAIPPPTCQQFDLRLTNQTTYTTQGFYQVNEGNVETCINGSYHSICDIGFDDVEAQLICNALGYSAPFYRKLVLQGARAIVLYFTISQVVLLWED